MNRISNEYYIIIIFIGPRARTTIHTTSPGRNNSKQDLIKIITIFLFLVKKNRASIARLQTKYIIYNCLRHYLNTSRQPR